eukprot:sb/3460715/
MDLMSKEGKVKVTKIIRADGISYRPAGGGAVSDSAEPKKSENSTKSEQAASAGKKKKIIKRADGTKIVVVDGKIVKKLTPSEAASQSPRSSHDPDIRDVSPDPLNFGLSIMDCPFIFRFRNRHICNLCDRPLNSDKQILEHLQGKKHLTAVEEFDVNPRPLPNRHQYYRFTLSLLVKLLILLQVLYDEDYEEREGDETSGPLQRTIFQGHHRDLREALSRKRERSGVAPEGTSLFRSAHSPVSDQEPYDRISEEKSPTQRSLQSSQRSHREKSPLQRSQRRDDELEAPVESSTSLRTSKERPRTSEPRRERRKSSEVRRSKERHSRERQRSRDKRDREKKDDRRKESSEKHRRGSSKERPRRRSKEGDSKRSGEHSSSRKQTHRSQNPPERKKRSRSRERRSGHRDEKRKSPSHRRRKRTRSQSPKNQAPLKPPRSNLGNLLGGSSTKENLMELIQKQAEEMLRNQDSGPIDEAKKKRLRETLVGILKSRGLVAPEGTPEEGSAVLQKLHQKYRVEMISPEKQMPSPVEIQPMLPPPALIDTFKQKDDQDYEALSARLDALQSSEQVEGLISSVEQKIKEVVSHYADSDLLEKRIKRYQKLVAKVVIKAETIKEREEEDSYRQFETPNAEAPVVAYPIQVENKPWLHGEHKPWFQTPEPAAPSSNPPEITGETEISEDSPDIDSKTLVKMIDDVHAQYVSSRPGYHVCLLCMIESIDENNFNMHLMGKKHKEQVTTRIRKIMKPGAKDVRCVLCNLTFQTHAKYLNHCKKRAHTVKVEAFNRIGKEIPEPEYLERSELDIEAPVVGRAFLSSRTSLDPISLKPMTFYQCSLCNTTCSSELQVEKHVRSKQHYENYNGMQNREEEREDPSERLKKMYEHAQASGAIMPVKKRKEARNNVPPSQPPVSEEYPVASGYAYYDQRGAPAYPATAAQYDGEEQEDPYANYPTEYPSTSLGYEYAPYKTSSDQYNHEPEIPFDLHGKVWKPKVTAATAPAVAYQDPSYKEESHAQQSAYKPVPGPYKTVRPYTTVEPSKARPYKSVETPVESQYSKTAGDQYKRTDPYDTSDPYETTDPYGADAPVVAYPIQVESKPWLHGEHRPWFQQAPEPAPQSSNPSEISGETEISEDSPDIDSKTLVKMIDDVHAQYVSSRPGYHVCLLCMIESIDENNFNMHLMGKKHKEQVTTRIRKIMKPGAKDVRCVLCNLTFQTHAKYMNHCKKRAHTVKVEAFNRIGKEIPEPEYLERSELDIEAPVVGRAFLSSRTSLDPISLKPMTFYQCSLCNTTCSSELQVEKHVRSKQHYENYNGMQNREEEREDPSERLKKMYEHAQASGMLLACCECCSIITVLASAKVATIITMIMIIAAWSLLYRPDRTEQTSCAIMPVKKRKEARNNVPSQPPVSEEYPVASGYAYYDQRGAPAYPAAAAASYEGEEDPYANYPTEYPSTSSGYEYAPYKTSSDQYNHEPEIPFDLHGKVNRKWQHQQLPQPYTSVEPSKARPYKSIETPVEGQYGKTAGDQYKRTYPYDTSDPYETTDPYGASADPYGASADPYETTEQPPISYKSSQYNGGYTVPSSSGYAVSGESYYHDPPLPQEAHSVPRSAPRSVPPQSASRPTPPPQSVPRSIPPPQSTSRPTPLPPYGTEAAYHHPSHYPYGAPPPPLPKFTIPAAPPTGAPFKYPPASIAGMSFVPPQYPAAPRYQ